MAMYNTIWGTVVVDELIACGVSFACISPGSRSTPLTAALAKDTRIHKQLCIDERAAAYVALGYARATGKPAVLVCTSGTAVANYLPAVVEASVDHVPMLIFSADRPHELLGTGANQTIEQARIFGSYTRWFQDIPTPSKDISLDWLRSSVDQAHFQSVGLSPGPVHLNFHFRKPLDPVDIDREALLSDRRTPHTSWPRPKLTQPADVEESVKRLEHIERGLVVLGRMPSSMPKQEVRAFAQRLGWPVLSDIGSGMQLGPDWNGHIPRFDLLLSSPLAAKMKPDVILHIGGPVVSNAYLSWLKEDTPHIIQLQSTPDREDPDAKVTLRIVADIPETLRQWSTYLPISELGDRRYEWRTKWNDLQELYDKTCRALMTDSPFSEPSIVNALTQMLPEEHACLIGNSMPIRDMDRFGRASKACFIGANRGASGIDGLVASAVGFALGHQRMTTLLIGDLSLLHDLNSLYLCKHAPYPVIVVVLNNSGGGIFGHLPIAKQPDVFDTYFTTPHELQFAPLAESIGLSTTQVQTVEAFRDAYTRALEGETSCVIECITKRDDNMAFYENLRAHIREWR